jgi:hypothetical protein
MPEWSRLVKIVTRSDVRPAVMSDVRRSKSKYGVEMQLTAWLHPGHGV